jgi:hypothetical protein
MLYITGFKKATQKLTFEDRATLKSVLIDYHCIVKVKAEMDQFIEGIATTDVLRLMRHSPAKFKCLFVPSLNIITANKLKGKLKIEFPDTISKKTIAWILFSDFLDLCDGNHACM